MLGNDSEAGSPRYVYKEILFWFPLEWRTLGLEQTMSHGFRDSVTYYQLNKYRESKQR